MTMDEENENLDLSGEYTNKSDFSKAGQVMTQVKVCEDKRSQEMRHGYYNFDKLGNRIYIPDSRKAFISSVIALRNLLKPEIQRDKIFQKEEEKIKKEIEQAKKPFEIYPMIVKNNKIVIDYSQEKYIPNIGAMIPVEKRYNNEGNSTKRIIQYIPGLFDTNHHNYWDKLVELYDELFSKLNELIDRNNYFDEGINY